MFQKLLNDNVLVRLLPDPDMSGGGIVLTRPNAVRKGYVLAVGPGKDYSDRYVATQAQVGELVAFTIGATDTKSGKQVTYLLGDGERLIRETDILFVIDDKDESLDVRI